MGGSSSFLIPGMLFIPSVPRNEVNFFKAVAAGAHKNGYTRFVEPAAGAMTMAHIAAQGGFPGHMIESSDMSLFSTAFGHGIMGKDLSAYDVQAVGFEHEDLTDPATVMWVEAVCRADHRATTLYWQEVARSFRYERQKHLDTLNVQIDRAQTFLKGMTYTAEDMYAHLDRSYADHSAVIMLNPPTIKAGFEKFFDTGGRVTWKQPRYEVFNPSAGYEKLRWYMENSEALLTIKQEGAYGSIGNGSAVMVTGGALKAKTDHGISKSINFYVIANRPDEVRKYAGGVGVVPWAGWKANRGGLASLPENWPINEKTDVFLDLVPRDVGYYHQMLWQHRFLGVPASGDYVGIFLDGYLAGIYGYDSAYLSSAGMYGQDSGQILRINGFSVPQHRFRFNRLLTRLSLTRESLGLVLNPVKMAKVDTVFTAQLTPHPESKELRGIMTLSKRRPDGAFGNRLIYTAPVRDQSAKEAYEEWLKDEQRYQASRPKVASS